MGSGLELSLFSRLIPARNCMGLGRSRQGDVLNHAECGRIVEVFEPRGLPLFVAYYRRALPRFVHARELLRAGTTGTSTSVHIF